MSPSVRPVLSALLLTFLACTPDGPSGPPFSVRDSAGIAIAENGGTLSPGDGGWAVAREPVLAIGALEGDEAYLFQRIWGATRLSDGRIAAVDTRAPNLRIYDPDGEHLHTFGRRGEGPGEFSSPVLMGTLPGDTLLVVDRRLRRINIFHPDDGFIRDATADAEIPGYLLTEGMFADGDILVQRMVFNEGAMEGFSRRRVHYRSVSPDGSLGTDFGEFVGEEIVMAVNTEGQITNTIMGNAPFGKSAAVAVGDTRFFYGSQDRYEIQSWTQEGRLDRIVRVLRNPEPVTSEQVGERLAAELSDLPDNALARSYRRNFENAPIPEFHPAFGSIYVDSADHLWVEETRITEDEPRIASIFDPEGRAVGSVTLPARLRIFEIGTDYILGAYADDLGVEYLRMYPLTRPD